MAAAIGTLFAPLPALADPLSAPFAPAVPDAGSRPVAVGTLTMPGRQPTGPAPAPVTGAATNPVLQKVEKGRAEIAALGDQLIRLGQERDLARDQAATARDRGVQAATALRDAQAAAVEAAAAAVRESAAMPPGTIGSGLAGLDDLARIQRGDVDSRRAAARQLDLAAVAVQVAAEEQTQAERRLADLERQYTTLNTTVTRRQAAQQQLERANAGALSAAEATQNATDSRLGQEILAGGEAGRGADPRALQAVNFALAQRGDPYVWSEEGPDQYDCSGLMFAAYRSVGFPLTRVSRDQYWQTRNKVVDRYSLLPGDLLFFSSSTSWQGIHHVAMYAGDGMMVEAPRSGLNVRLVPVRWSRLFQATRIFGSVEGVTQAPVLGPPDPEPAEDRPTRPPITTVPPILRPTTPPATSKPATPPKTTPPKTTNPTTGPTSKPATPTTPPPKTTSPTPSTSPSPSRTTEPSATPRTSAPPTTKPADNSPSNTSPANDNTSSAATRTTSTGSSSATRTTSSSESTAATKSSATSPASASSSSSK